MLRKRRSFLCWFFSSSSSPSWPPQVSSGFEHYAWRQIDCCRVKLLFSCCVVDLTGWEMKSKPTKSQANGSKSKVKKGAAEHTSLSKKLRDKIDGETSKAGVLHRLDDFGDSLCQCCFSFGSWMNGSLRFAGPSYSSAGAQRKTGPGSILHYIYRSTLGQSLHSQMRQVNISA